MVQKRLFVVSWIAAVVFSTAPSWGQGVAIINSDSTIVTSNIAPTQPDPTNAINDAPPKPRELVNKTPFKFKKQGGVVYAKSAEYEIKCDLYIPAGDGPFPAILAVHGGAWRQGTKFTMLRHAWRMAGAGYVVVAINYRHAPKYPFPAQVHDCKQAVRWMRANAEKFKIDSDRIGAFGYSAGGQLVAMLGTTDASDGLEGNVEPGLEPYSTRVKAVAAGGAPCDFSWIEDDSRVLTYWLGGSRNEKPEAYRTASPSTYITKDDPPFYFFHGESDLVVPCAASKKMHDALVESKISSQYSIAARGGHVGTFSDLGWMDKAIEFFDLHLK